MPELPEVETVKKGLEPFLVGQSLKLFQLNRPNLRFPIPPNIGQQSLNQTITHLSRHGKSMIWHFESAQPIIWHLGMSGSFRASLRKNAIEKKHDHVIMETNDGARIIFNDPRRFGALLYMPDHFKGIDPYSEAYTLGKLFPLFKPKQTPIKTALLDQTLITGIGNIYACEALFYAGIKPSTPCARISKARYDTLFSHIKNVLDKAITSGGSSLKDHVMVHGEAGKFQHQFAVYDRDKMPCIQCDKMIEKTTMAGRSTYYCSICQR